MIILITGASHTGKTLLAQRMLEKYKYPILSMDLLKMGLIRSKQTNLTPLSSDNALTNYLWPIVREIIKTAIENKQNLIVEGCYIPFDWQQDFEKKYLAEIQYICLAMTEKYIDAHFDEIKKYATVIEVRLDDSECTKDFLKQENKAYIRGCQACKNPITLIEGDYQSVQHLNCDVYFCDIHNRQQRHLPTK